MGKHDRMILQFVQYIAEQACEIIDSSSDKNTKVWSPSDTVLSEKICNRMISCKCSQTSTEQQQNYLTDLSQRIIRLILHGVKLSQVCSAE